MKKFYGTSKAGVGRDAHSHVAYINEELRVAALSTDNGHTHELMWQEETPEQMDEMGNVIAPATPGGWIMHPAFDGHTHELTNLKSKKKEKAEEDDQIINDIHFLYKAAREEEQDSFEAADESEKYYMGEQWEDEVKSKLEGLDRAALTINKIAKGVDELVGYQIEQRTDTHYVPFEGGDSRVADLLNIVARHVDERCYYAREETKGFKDCVITGRGNYNFLIDFNTDLRGEIKIEKYPWRQVAYGPHEKEDLSDCEYLIKSKMFSLGKLKQLYGDKAEDIQRDYEAYLDEYPTVSHSGPGDDWNRPDSVRKFSVLGESLVDIAKKEFRVFECWRRVYIPTVVAANPAEDVYLNLYGWKKEDIDKVATIPGFQLIKRNEAKIRITRIAGGMVLSDENPAELPIDDFFIVPVYANKRDSRYWGKVEAVKDPQREINRRHSQTIDILNKVASYGYYIDESTFVDANEKERFKSNSTSPGWITQVMDLNKIPRKEEGVKFPSELVQLIQFEDQQIMDIMNITIEQGGANTSAAAMLQRKELRLKGNEFIFDNLSFAKIKMGRIKLRLIQKYYPADRIYRIVNDVNSKTPVQIGGEDFSQYTQEEIEYLINNSDLEKYDVVVSESAHSPTTRLSTFTLLQEMAQAGAQVPPEVIIELSPLPEEYKKKIQASMAAQQAALAGAEDAKSKAEINKTLIAQGVIPPEIQEQLQPQGGQGMGQGLPAEQVGIPENSGIAEGVGV